MFCEFLFNLGTLNPEEDCEQAENYLRSQYSFYLEPSFSSSPRQPSNINQNLSRRDELARQYMYTSVQQASYSDVPWGKMNKNIILYICMF